MGIHKIIHTTKPPVPSFSINFVYDRRGTHFGASKDYDSLPVIHFVGNMKGYMHDILSGNSCWLIDPVYGELPRKHILSSGY